MQRKVYYCFRMLVTLNVTSPRLVLVFIQRVKKLVKKVTQRQVVSSAIKKYFNEGIEDLIPKLRKMGSWLGGKMGARLGQGDPCGKELI
jgi:hypothetical protein